MTGEHIESEVVTCERITIPIEEKLHIAVKLLYISNYAYDIDIINAFLGLIKGCHDERQVADTILRFIDKNNKKIEV